MKLLFMFKLSLWLLYPWKVSARIESNPNSRYLVKLKELPDQQWIHNATVNKDIHFYSISESFHFLIGEYSHKDVMTLKSSPYVEYVEIDRPIQPLGLEKNPPSWGLDRLDQTSLPLDAQFNYIDNGGEGVDIYIVDTGIFVEHEEFEGRAKWGKVVTNEPSIDANGHGTFVAGIIGGKTYGVAKKANLHAVLDELGGGMITSVILGMMYVQQEHRNKISKKTVVNLSLGMDYYRIMNEVIEEVIMSGIVVVAAAGNGDGFEGQDSCYVSPASAPNVITVGSTQENDEISPFSNYGKCVTLYAPGELITSSYIGSTTAFTVLSGTSFAAPHVTGIVALILSATSTKLYPVEIRERVINMAVKGVLSTLPIDTPNLLANSQLHAYMVTSESWNLNTGHMLWLFLLSLGLWRQDI
ncbi:hypothetical protein K7432_002408 [Basidiobolus ranarum]|uniref:Peptidase S8/S53 domain-containing protein n=1 Tax=Basidiobolus ranarum TaxID=34480 RepID=A0ABR2X1J2_9FUNG